MPRKDRPLKVKNHGRNPIPCDVCRDSGWLGFMLPTILLVLAVGVAMVLLHFLKDHVAPILIISAAVGITNAAAQRIWPLPRRNAMFRLVISGAAGALGWYVGTGLVVMLDSAFSGTPPMGTEFTSIQAYMTDIIPLLFGVVFPAQSVMIIRMLSESVTDEDGE